MRDALVRDARAGPAFKGLAPATFGRRLNDLVRERVSLFDGTFSPPVMVLKGGERVC